jgi:hypothetical protein
VSKICHLDGPQVTEKIENVNFWQLCSICKTDKICSRQMWIMNVFFAFAAAFKYIGYVAQKV